MPETPPGGSSFHSRKTYPMWRSWQPFGCVLGTLCYPFRMSKYGCTLREIQNDWIFRYILFAVYVPYIHFPANSYTDIFQIIDFNVLYVQCVGLWRFKIHVCMYVCKEISKPSSQHIHYYYVTGTQITQTRRSVHNPIFSNKPGDSCFVSRAI